ncbi:M16 family metallopeptidase [Sphingomonas colocasiae]|uniref:Insulinase family protein n=1 Tax=Sphingomonas colocasiae TaxID=1848973 RepID=A0ABS7PRW7_9SPHN|nr:M16 family metallopeptidase [Sphingomonas colocasiae]MBY8824075.1 insulinase family protein [Sphingomonas colocasiae]
MTFQYRRIVRFAVLPLIAGLGFSTATLFAKDAAKRGVVSAVPAVPAPRPTPWLYVNSDVPQEKAWLFGTLDNGLRYAIRRNAVPPGQVSIRVRIDAGSLMENDSELGFAHFLEHLSFRGSKDVPELEAKRIWQRLGATFGSDSNASTTPTETVYKLDLPQATAESVDESLRILAGMMDSPNISDQTVNSERAVVLAEQREQFGAAVKVGDALRAHFFSGQKLATRSPIGTTATLTGATATGLKAFHDRWYRPERAVVVVSGDLDPAVMEAMVRNRFSGWKGDGPAPADPDFGKPDMKAPAAAAVVEPSFPTMIQMAVLRPWEQVEDTISYNEGLMVDAVALRIINRRLETRARAGGSFLQAQVDQEDVSRSADTTTVSLVPIGDDWRAALRDVRAVIAEATTVPPGAADIEREVSEFDLALLGQVENAGAEPGSKQADDLVRAVDIRETVTTPQGALDIFRGAKRLFTPERIRDATKRLFAGAGPRILLITPKTVPNATQLASAALSETVTASTLGANARAVTFDDVPKLGTPGTVVSRSSLTQLPIETVKLSNGVNLILFPNQGEPGKVYVSVRFGNGYKALPAKRETLAWSGPMALVGTGIGDLGLEELDRLTNGRKINMGVSITEDAFVMSAETRAPDLADQLKLLAAKLDKPGWDPAPIVRARAQLLASYEIMGASPGNVLTRDLDALVRGGDPRWTTPDRKEIEALTPESFRALWAPLLATGPIEVQIFGDFKTEDAVNAALATFGAMKPRGPAPIEPGSERTGVPVHVAKPVTRTHSGPPEQAAAVIAWPTGGGLDTVVESRKLEVLAAIFNDRLFDQLRNAAGASYSPTVSSQWPTGMDNGGYMIVLGQLKPEGVDLFFKLSREIAADLAAKPVDADELARTLGPIKQYYARAGTANQFWLRQTAGSSRDPRRIAAMASLARDFLQITPEQIQETAKRYLAPGKDWSMVVLPQAAVPKAAPAKKTAAR